MNWGIGTIGNALHMGMRIFGNTDIAGEVGNNGKRCMVETDVR
jgi:hypothetical protein